MINIGAWRFNHTSTDFGKLCLSTLLVMLPELPMSFILKFTEHRFLFDVTRGWGEHSACHIA